MKLGGEWMMSVMESDKHACIQIMIVKFMSQFDFGSGHTQEKRKRESISMSTMFQIRRSMWRNLMFEYHIHAENSLGV